MMILVALKLMLLYLIEIGTRLRRFLKYWFRRFATFFRKEDIFGNPILDKAAEEIIKATRIGIDLENKCCFLEEQRDVLDAKIETYRVLKHNWKKLLTGLDCNVRSSAETSEMIENTVSFLLSAKHITVLAQREFENSHKAVERYEETMRGVMQVLSESGLIQLFSTDHLEELSKLNVSVYHIALLREEVFFLQKILYSHAKRPKFGSPRTWEEFLAQYKEEKHA